MIALAATACSSDGNKGTSRPIPRATAYPRANLYDAVYTTGSLPAGFAVNSATKITETKVHTDDRIPKGSRWVDIVYPAYGATLYCTFTPVTDDASRISVTDNRMERMSLNLGENFATRTELQSDGGYTTVILTSLGSMLTPVQFLSAGEQWVISGAMQFADSDVKPDSVLPMIEAVTADITHAARHLK